MFNGIHLLYDPLTAELQSMNEHLKTVQNTQLHKKGDNSAGANHDTATIMFHWNSSCARMQSLVGVLLSSGSSITPTTPWLGFTSSWWTHGMPQFHKGLPLPPNQFVTIGHIPSAGKHTWRQFSCGNGSEVYKHVKRKHSTTESLAAMYPHLQKLKTK